MMKKTLNSRNKSIFEKKEGQHRRQKKYIYTSNGQTTVSKTSYRKDKIGH